MEPKVKAKTEKLAFKTSYSALNADDYGFMYGNNLQEYEITFCITNTGAETCSASKYEISWDDDNLKAVDLVKNGNFTSIEAGKSQKVRGKFTYGYFTEEYKDVTVKFSITYGEDETWNDSVTLRFYRGWVNYKINALSFNQSSTAQLNASLVSSFGPSISFTVDSGKTKTIAVPWSHMDCYLVFRGANNDSEMCYSFIAEEKGSPADLSGVWEIAEIDAYEPNDKKKDAVTVINSAEPVKAYLKSGDTDYYRLNVSDLTCSTGTIVFADYRIIDDTDISDSNNGDRVINKGETIWMDIAIHNTGKKIFTGVNAKLSTDSKYVTFVKDPVHEYDKIQGGYYKNSYTSDDAPLSSNQYLLYDKQTPYKFTISKNCPAGTVIPFIMTITDDNGNIWTDSFNITVEKINADLKYKEYRISDNTGIISDNIGNSWPFSFSETVE